MSLSLDQIRIAQTLWRKWGMRRTIGSDGHSFAQDVRDMHGWILQEKRAIEAGKVKATRGLLAEVRGECRQAAILVNALKGE